jgi:hypothetical protein
VTKSFTCSRGWSLQRIDVLWSFRPTLCKATRIFVTILSALLVASCGKSVTTGGSGPTDPNDETVAIFGFDNGKQVISSGKLHSHVFIEICSGSYPEVSPSGRYLAYNPNGTRNPAIQPINVVEISTGKTISFASIPTDLLPNPSSFWSKDEKSIAFKVHDFGGDRDSCVVDVVGGNYWRGSEADFTARFGNTFGPIELNARHSPEGRLTVENYGHVGALYFHPDTGQPIRLTSENMGVPSPPIWIERTREVLFVGVYTRPPYSDEDVSAGVIYLIKPEAKDWAHASEGDWKNAAVSPGEQVSSSK